MTEEETEEMIEETIEEVAEEVVVEDTKTTKEGIRTSKGTRARVKAVQVSRDLLRRCKGKRWRERTKLLNKDKDLRGNSET